MTFCARVMPGQEEEEEEEEAWESYVDPVSLCIWMWNPKTKEFRWATPREWAPYRDPKSGRKYWWNPKTEQIFWLPGQEEEEEEEALESYVDPLSGDIWMWNHKTGKFHWATPREWEPYRDPESGLKYMWNPKTEQIFWPSESHLPSDACGSDGRQPQPDALETPAATLSNDDWGAYTPAQADAVQNEEELVCRDQARHQLPHLRGELACGERCVNCSCRDTGPEMLNLCCLRCRETNGSRHDAQCDQRQPQPDALETSAADAKQQQPGKEDDMLADWSKMTAKIMSPRSYQRDTRYNKIGHSPNQPLGR